MNITDILFAKSLSGGGGGGGSSDFSTASVSFINNTGDEAGLGGAFCMEGGIYPVAYLEEDTTMTVVLYKGLSALIPFGTYTISTSGSATYNPDMNAIIVEGNCTITLA